MAQPRRSSRPHHSLAEDRLGVHRGRRSPPEQATSAGPPDDAERIDPGRLTEDAFRDRRPADAPETHVVAWLAALQAPANAPRAAATLIGRLMREHDGTLSPWQSRMIELLAFVARHRRRGPMGALHTIETLSK